MGSCTRGHRKRWKTRVNEHKASEQGTRVRFARKIPSLLLTASGTSRIVYTHSTWREAPGGNFIQMKISYAHVNEHLQLFFSNFTVCLMRPARLVTWPLPVRSVLCVLPLRIFKQKILLAVEAAQYSPRKKNHFSRHFFFLQKSKVGLFYCLRTVVSHRNTVVRLCAGPQQDQQGLLTQKN